VKDNLELEDIRLFHQVAHAGSITGAARQLNLPKSTVSRRLIRFEDGLGLKLFHKSTRRIVLTELGERYLERCAGVVREMSEASAFLESITTRASGVLRITMPVDIGVYFMSDFLVAFARWHPELRLDIDYSARRVDLVGERFDVAIRGAAALADSNLIASRFLPIPRGLYASPAYLAETGRPTDPAELAAHQFVMLDAHTHPRPEFNLVNGRRTFRVRMSGRFISNSMGNVRALALAGGGIGIVPHRMCAEDVAQGRLVHILRQWSPPPLDGWYVIPSRKLLPAKTRLFVQALVEHFRERPRKGAPREAAPA
jgi:DNA-binding transcriptional LysR family regulator